MYIWGKFVPLKSRVKFLRFSHAKILPRFQRAQTSRCTHGMSCLIINSCLFKFLCFLIFFPSLTLFWSKLFCTFSKPSIAMPASMGRHNIFSGYNCFLIQPFSVCCFIVKIFSSRLIIIGVIHGRFVPVQVVAHCFIHSTNSTRLFCTVAFLHTGSADIYEGFLPRPVVRAVPCLRLL